MQNEVLAAIIGATALVSSTIVAGIFKILENRRRKTEKASKKESITQMGLFEKDLFSKSEYLINYTIKTFGFDDDNKKWIYETIMKVKIETISRKSREFIQQNDLMSLSDAKFESSIFALVSDIIDEYNILIKEEFKGHFGKNKGEKIFNLVMNKQPTKESPSMGFNIWHASTITYLEKSIANHCGAIYLNNIEKMDMILDDFKCAVNSVHTHMYKTFCNFNGELDYLLLM